MSQFKLAAAAGMILPLLAMSANAHHSFAAYDVNKTISVQTTIKEFDWGAPHSSGTFLVAQPGGSVETVTVVAAAPNSFVSQGFHAHDFKKGTQVTLIYHPLRTGSTTGGSLAGLMFPDGRKFGDTEPGAKASP